jgi:hypothetical protein
MFHPLQLDAALAGHLRKAMIAKEPGLFADVIRHPLEAEIHVNAVDFDAITAPPSLGGRQHG